MAAASASQFLPDSLRVYACFCAPASIGARQAASSVVLAGLVARLQPFVALVRVRGDGSTQGMLCDCSEFHERKDRMCRHLGELKRRFKDVPTTFVAVATPTQLCACAPPPQEAAPLAGESLAAVSEVDELIDAAMDTAEGDAHMDDVKPFRSDLVPPTQAALVYTS